MKQASARSRLKRFVVVSVLVLIHPILLCILFPKFGERANLVALVAPIAATWLFSWRIGIPVAFLNGVVTAVVFSLLGNQGPDDLPMGLVIFLLISVICLGVGSVKGFFDRGKEMAAELDRLRRS